MTADELKQARQYMIRGEGEMPARKGHIVRRGAVKLASANGEGAIGGATHIGILGRTLTPESATFLDENVLALVQFAWTVPSIIRYEQPACQSYDINVLSCLASFQIHRM